MRVESLEIRRLRCLNDAQIVLPAAGAWLLGPNGSGKTSVLEALTLLGFGRSFRGRVADGLVQRGQASLEVVARWVDGSGRLRVSGLRHGGESWEGRLDGAAVESLSELAAPFPVVCFHPESSRVVSGPAEERRRALDWLAFHVEPGFAPLARRYARALKQRNALLRLGAPDTEFDAWEQDLGATAEALTARRRSALALWQPVLLELWPALAASAAPPQLELRPGWRAMEAPLGTLLRVNRPRDRELGYTTIGSQRADLSLGSPFAVDTEQLSRGQAKLVAVGLLLGQAEALRRRTGEHSLLLLDDLQAELDDERQWAVLDWLVREGYQVVISGTRADPQLLAHTRGLGLFHVEHGKLKPEHRVVS